MSKAVITDFGVKEPDVERSILQPLGCEVVLAKCKTPDEVAAAVKDADYIMTGFAPINAQVIAGLSQAKIIVRYGIGYDNVDLPAAAKKGIPVCNVPDYCIQEVADHTLALMLALTRQIVANWDVMRGGEWKLAAPLEDNRALRDMTVGLVAFGRIAREVAARLKPFHCRIGVCDPLTKPEAITQAGCVPMDFNTLLAESDLLSLHCPSLPETRGMMNKDTFARMKKRAFFVNASRGDLVITEDLIEALRSGHLAGAGLDVTKPEPVPKDSPFLTMKNVVMAPHCASASIKAQYALRSGVANRVAAVIRGERPPSIVNGL